MTAGERLTAAYQATVVGLSGELDAGDASWVAPLKAALSADARQIVVDLRDVSFIDSSVIRELLRAYRAVQPGGWLRLVYTHNTIHRIIEVCGLLEVFPQYLTPAAAGRGNPRKHPWREVEELSHE